MSATIDTTITTYIGGYFEWQGGAGTSYYFAGAQRIAMRTGTDVKYLLGDHLGSTSVTALASGAFDTETRYYPWGGVRWSSGPSPTDYMFTGQQEVDYIGLYFYNSRFYDVALGRFVSPDTIIPQQQGSQAWDRYAGMNNNPLRYTDPTGHYICEEDNCLGQKIYSSHKADTNRDGNISKGEAITYFVMNLQDPVNELTVTTRFGAACTMAGCSGHHPGVDIVGDHSITATSNGIVVDVDSNPEGDFGMKVVVQTDVFGYRFYSIYAHLSAIAVKPGVEISAGASIGTMGSTPVNSDNWIHLHYEVRTEANVNLDTDGTYLSLPTSATSYWADSLDDLLWNWIDLGPRFGYSTNYPE